MAVVALRPAARLLLVALLMACAGKAMAADRAPFGDAASFQVAALDPFAPAAKPLVPETSFTAKWRRVERELRADLQRVALCRAEPEKCAPAARRFIAIVDAARKREGRARIGEINRALNLAIRPLGDSAQHGAPDVWTAPLATLASGAGDCEDYAIAKFAAFQELGFAAADLRLMVVHEAGSPSNHAVLSVRLDGGWLILDNRRLAMVDEKSFPARPILALQAEGVNDDARAPALAAAAGDGLQNFAGWSAPPLLM